MHHRIALFVLLLLLLAVPAPIRAQQNSWQSLQEAKVGQKVTVVDRQMKTYHGQFVRYTDTDLTVKIDGQPMTLDRDDVVRVTVTGHHRARNTLIGLAVGAAAGGALAAAWNKSMSGFEGNDAAGVVLFSTAIGAGIGALCPGSRTVYRAGEQRKQGSVSPVKVEPPTVHAE